MSVSNCCRVFTAITAVAICWRWPSNKKSTFLYRWISTGPLFIICCHMCFNRYTMTDSGNISIWCEVRKTNGTVMFGLKKLLFMHCDLWLLFAKLQQTCEFIVSANNRQTRYSMGTLVIALPLTLIVMNLLRPVNSISLPVYASYNRLPPFLSSFTEKISCTGNLAGGSGHTSGVCYRKGGSCPLFRIRLAPRLPPLLFRC